MRNLLVPLVIMLMSELILTRCLRGKPLRDALTPTTAPALSPQALAAMDWMRVLAAFAVLLWHVRWLLLVDLTAADAPSVVLRTFYFVTHLGHQAVVIFFILSGFFIGWAVITASYGGRWSWPMYALRRGTRLYAVLVPGLVLTLLWDSAGAALFGSAHGVYAGELEGHHVGLTDLNHTLSVWYFLGNLCFLQHMFIAPFGSNDPLWSLSYEFWAYVILPLLVRAACMDERPTKRAGFAALSLALLIVGGANLHFYFAIWLTGAGLALLWYLRPTRLRNVWPVWTAGALCIVALMAAQWYRDSLSYTDPALGVATATFLWTILAWSGGKKAGTSRTAVWLGNAGRSLAGLSYTLYVCHYPLLTFLHAWYLHGHRLTPTAGTVSAVFIIAVLVVALYAYPLSRLTEAQTDRLRLLLQRFLRLDAAAIVRARIAIG